MSAEIKRRGSAVRLELQGIGKEIYRRSKTRYTRAFLLTCADFDVCRQLPPGGVDPLLFRCVLDDAPRDMLQPWRRSGDMPVNPNGTTECSTPQSSKRGTCGPKSPTKSGASSDNLSPTLNGGSILQEKRLSAAQCKAVVLDHCVKESQKTGSYQLRKSENPYRPPHVFQVGSNKLEDQSFSEKSNSFEVIHSTGRKETPSRAHDISSDKDNQITISGDAVIEHGGNTVDLCLTKDFHSDSDSCKINVSMNGRESNQRHSRMFLKEHMESFLTAKNCRLSTVIENAEPKHLAANMESEMGRSANLCACGIEGLGSDSKYSSEKHTVNLEMRQDDKPVSDIPLSELCCSRAPNSGQAGSDDWTTRTDFSKPYEFPFVDAFGFLTSSAGAGIAIRPLQKSIVAVNVAGQTELYDMEDNGLDFDDVWSEVLAAMRFEQEMDRISVSEYGQTADSEIQVSLSDGNSFISTAYPSSCEPLEGSNCDNNADSDDEICLPDENNLISIDHMTLPDSLTLEDDKSSVKDATLTSNLTDKFAKEPVTVGISRHKRRSRSVPRHSTVPPFHDFKATFAHQDLRFQHSNLQSPWTGINAVIPFDFQQTQMTLQMPLAVPMAPYPYSAVNWYTCTNMHRQPSPSPKECHSPSPKQCDSLVPYSVQQQPITFP